MNKLDQLTISLVNNEGRRYFEGLDDISTFKLSKLKLTIPFDLDVYQLGFLCKSNLSRLKLIDVNSEVFGNEFFENR